MPTQTVSFRPTKKLFIDVLTKDIPIRHCILDLLDNSVDSYTRHAYQDKRSVKVAWDRSHFEVWDDCGGVSKDQLRNQVFRPGLSDLAARARTIGVYGIGLKRAIFRLGRVIVFETDDGVDYCRLVIDVDAWVSKPDDDWDLDLTETSASRLTSGQKPYTRITVTRLTDEAGESLTTDFEKVLKERIGIYYSRFIQDGNIAFYVNDELQAGFEIKMNVSDDYQPVRAEYQYDGVSMDIRCWIDLKGAEEKRREFEIGRKGWNIYMNRRLVILDDTSEKTGWRGEKPFLPKYHQIYHEFRGIVFIAADDPSRLPINTSKDDFDTDTRVYTHLTLKMSEVARPLIDYLSEKYHKEKTTIEDGESALATSAAQAVDQQSGKNLRELTIDTAQYTSVFSPPTKPAAPPGVKLTSIQYQKPRDKVDLVKSVLEVRTNQEVGSITFDYFWDSEGLNELRKAT